MKSKIHEHQKNSAISVSKKLIYVSLLLVSFVSFSQRRTDVKEVIPAGQTIELKDKKMFINNEQIPSYEIKKYLKDNDFKAYSLYTKAKNKSVFGGMLLGLGTALVVGDLVKGLVSDVQYPSAMSYIGGGLLIASIPVLSGKNKKMTEAIDLYNSGLKTTGELENNFDASLNIVANKNGVGLRLSF